MPAIYSKRIYDEGFLESRELLEVNNGTNVHIERNKTVRLEERNKYIAWTKAPRRRGVAKELRLLTLSTYHRRDLDRDARSCGLLGPDL